MLLELSELLLDFLQTLAPISFFTMPSYPMFLDVMLQSPAIAMM
jgi:hypothetical protein